MRSFSGSFLGAPIKDGFVSFNVDFMPHLERPHIYFTLQFPIPFIGTLFFTSLVEFFSLIDFKFHVNFTVHVRV